MRLVIILRSIIVLIVLSPISEAQECKDERPLCRGYKKEHCDHPWLKTHCKKLCGLCEGDEVEEDCKDIRDCLLYKMGGERCGGDWMKIYCKKTCGYCTGDEVEEDCKDSGPCLYHKNIGRCGEDWIKIDCKKTCGYCTGDEVEEDCKDSGPCLSYKNIGRCGEDGAKIECKKTCGYCTVNCPEGCQPDSCDDSGNCSNCIDGKFGEKCNQDCKIINCIGNCLQSTGQCERCQYGFYGGNCQKSCGRNCNGGCDQDTGDCQSCKSGFYGRKCENRCSSNCYFTSCNKEDGTCSRCKPGFYGPDCRAACDITNCRDSNCNQTSGTCSSCRKGFYRSNCQFRCSDGCIDNTCNKMVGSCSCKDGFHGEICESRCSDGCLYERCNTNGSCSCKDGFYGERCESRCSGGCLYERCNKDGSCSCKDGFHGEMCVSRCRDGCLYGRCNKDGSCSCKDGFYGNNCQNSCSERCTSGCESTSGRCLHCPQGFYGETCQNSCNINCLDGCDQTTGNCNKCKAGRKGHDCSQDESTTEKNSTVQLSTPRNDVRCTKNSIKVFIPLKFAKANYYVLKDPRCGTYNNGTHLLIEFKFDECGTQLEFKEDSLVFSNQLKEISDSDEVISIQCEYPRLQNVSLRNNSYPPETKVVIFEKGRGVGFMSIQQYKDGYFVEPVTSSMDKQDAVKPGDLIYMKIAVEGAFSNVKVGVIASTCTVVPISQEGEKGILLVENNCVKNADVKIYKTEKQFFQFHFPAPAFKIAGKVHVRCQVAACNKRSDCYPNCPKKLDRKRRSIRSSSDSLFLTSEPIVVRETSEKYVKGGTIALAGLSILSVVLLVAVIILVKDRQNVNKRALFKEKEILQ